MAGTLCIFGPTCGLGMALEHNGDLYSCDHFVEPDCYLGNIMEKPMIELVISEKQRKFGQDKRDTLPSYCRACRFLLCLQWRVPRRIVSSKHATGELNLNYLCSGYRAFFDHADRYMQIMAILLRRGSDR